MKDAVLQLVDGSRSAGDAQRRRALQALRVLGPSMDDGFRRIAAIARRVFNVPLAEVSLLDSIQLGLAPRAGMHATPSPAFLRFGDGADTAEATVVVHNAGRGEALSIQWAGQRLRNMRFYAGCRLRNEAGYNIGTLALVDRQQRMLSDEDVLLLRELAGLAEHHARALAAATTDELTRIPNRRGFRQLAAEMLATCQPLDLPAALLAFDLNGLKKINDNLGHPAGDRALAEFARCLLLTCRESDALGRIGGDEFCVLLADTDGAGASALLERLQQRVAEANVSAAGELPIAFSVGVALREPGSQASVDQLVAEADRLLIEAKSARR